MGNPPAAQSWLGVSSLVPVAPPEPFIKTFQFASKVAQLAWPVNSSPDSGETSLLWTRSNPFTKPAAEDEHEVFLLGLALFAC